MLRALFRALFGRKKFETDLDAELQSHVELRAADLVRGGLSKDSATRQARVELGSREKFKEELREAAGIRFFDELSQDLRYALRVLRQSPAFTAVAIGSLALGIGMNTALFSVVNTLLLKDLPYKDADRLVYVTGYWPHEPVVPGPPSADFANWRAHLKSVDGIAAYGGGAGAITLTGAGEPERVEGTMVTSQLLDLLGWTPTVGRNFTAEEDRLGAAPTVILGYGLWQRRFGGASDVVGKVIQLDGIGRTVVGVLPAGFEFPDNNFKHEMLVPMALPASPSWQDPQHFRLLRVLVRRKPGVSLSALQKELVSDIRATASDEPAQFVTMRKDIEVRVIPLRQWLTGNVRTAVLVLQGAVAMVLLIACLNIAGLQVARAIARKKEIAVRAAIGASGGAPGAATPRRKSIGLLLRGTRRIAPGRAQLRALRTFLPSNLHLADTLRLDASVLAYTLAITLAAGILTGFVPALAALRIGLNDTLKEEGRSTGSRGQHRIRGALVIAEIGAAMVLLIGASVLIRTFAKLASAGLGFEPQGVLTLKVAPSPRRYPTSEKVAAFYAAALEKARAIPGVEVAAIGDGLPLVGNAGAAGISFEGRPAPPAGGRPSLPAAGISANYFQALQIPLLRGRMFKENEKAAVVNHAFAQEYYPNEDPLGKRIEIGSRGRWREIVGIVGTVKQKGRRPVDPFAIYFPFEETFAPETFLVLKSKLPDSALVAAATKAVESVDPSQPVFDVATMEDRLRESLATQRANMTLMAAFAALALVLATVGIFGVIAYFVNSRVQEIAIRMALGASSRTVVRMVLGHAMALAALGIAAGIGAALILTRTLGSLIEGIRANDPLSFVATAILFACIAALACSIPARRAARVDPMAALRHG